MTVEACQNLVRRALDLLIVELNDEVFLDLTEATIQHHFAMHLHLLALDDDASFKIALEKRISLAEGEFLKSGFRGQAKTVSELDVYFELGQPVTRCAIELKFFKQVNHREPNNRYDAYVDLGNLEIAQPDQCDVGFFLLFTDHPHYYDPAYRPHKADTADFCLRHDHRYTAADVLAYTTATPYGRDISLRNNYAFTWENLGANLKVLLVRVSANEQ